MKTFKEYITEIATLREENLLIESFLDEMANLVPDDTGLQYVVWLGEVGGQHGPRVKVSNTRGKMNASSCFVMSVDKNPCVLTPKSCKLKQSEIDDISDWIKLNYEALIALWNVFETGAGSATKIIASLEKI